MKSEAFRLNMDVVASERINDEHGKSARIDRQAELVLEQCWQNSVGDLRKFAIGLGVQNHAADDVLQDVFVTALTKAPSGIRTNDLRRWLFRVTANQCRLKHRKRSSWKRLFKKVAFSNLVSQSAETNGIETETNAAVHAALDSLSKNQRAVLVLKYFNDFDSTEIGSILKMSDATVRSHLRRGRLKLAKLLGDLSEDLQ